MRSTSTIQRDRSGVFCLCAIGNGGANVLFYQVRILFQHFFKAHAAGEKVQNERDLDARAADAWLAKADVRINRNAFQ